MKVLMIGNAPSVKGGITTVISQLLDHDWLEENVEMKFIPSYAGGNILKKILYFGGAYCKIKHTIKTWKPDVAHIHMSYRGSYERKKLLHQLCRKHHIADIIHLHGSEFEKWYLECSEKKQAEIRHFLRDVGAVIVLGEKWNAAIKRIEPETNTLCVSNTVKIPDETITWNSERFQVLYLGVLIPRKGVANLLNAVRCIKDQNDSLTNLHFVIAGTGPEEEALKKQCHELGIEDMVVFAGWTDGEKKKKLMQESQMLVLPSYNEGLPMSILEALSYGMPVVSTDVGDVSTAVVNGVNGFLVEPGSAEQIAEKVAELGKDENVFMRMSQNAKEIASNQFSDRAYYDAVHKCYLEITQ